MNDKFFSLPIEKQEKIINAGLRVFAQNSYKKSPMSEIADEAGISKSLLFHYFYNKKELYLFLWEKCAQVTLEYLQKYDCYGENDVFEIMHRGLKAKAHMMRRYPDMGRFTLKAYYEKDENVCQEIQESIAKYGSFQNNVKRLKMNPEQYISGIDLKMMYQDMYWASEGYIWEKMQNGEVNVDEMEQEFAKMIDFWKFVYLRKNI